MTRKATTLPYTELEVADGNFDTSRAPIDRVIIHTMVGTWQSAAARFDDPASRVSAHYGVKLDGGLIHWLEEFNTAYHAGDYAMNQRSIGIEHEDGGKYNDPRPDALYTASAKLVRDICTFYNIPIDRQHILKHSEVIATGCPDALDIDRIVREAAQTKPDQNIAKAVRFDQTLTILAKAGYLPDDHSENYIDNDKEQQAVQKLVDSCKQKDDTIGNLNKTISDKNATISLTQQQLSSLNDEVVSVTHQKDSLKAIALKVPQLEKELEQAKNDRTNCLTAQETQNKTIAQLRLNNYQDQPTKILVLELLDRVLGR